MARRAPAQVLHVLVLSAGGEPMGGMKKRALELACGWLRGHKMTLGEDVSDVTDRAAELVCGWLHRRGLCVEEALSGRLNAWIKVQRAEGSPVKSTPRGGAQSFPTWDWSGRPCPRDEAWIRVAAWLFSADDMSGPKTVEIQVARAAAPGWIQTTAETSQIPKFSFSSLEEFVLKAEASGEFPEEVRK